MKTNLFFILLTTYLWSIGTGIVVITVTSLFLNYYKGYELNFFMIVLSVFLDFVIGGILMVFFFLPFAIIERRRNRQDAFETLVKRYLPFIAIPCGILFCLIFFSSFPDEEAHHFFTMLSLTILCMSYAGLWSFFKKISHQKNESTY